MTDQLQLILGSLGALSLFLFVASVLVIPVVVILIPTDYFVRPPKPRVALTPVRLAGQLLKNALGLVLVLAGILMLFLPGQGILSILLGVSLLDFPRKKELQLRLLRVRGIQRTVNWIRLRANRPPIRDPG